MEHIDYFAGDAPVGFAAGTGLNGALANPDRQLDLLPSVVFLGDV